MSFLRPNVTSSFGAGMRRYEEHFVPDTMSPVEVVEHIPQFLDEITAVLRVDVGLFSVRPLPEESKIATGHGAQRLRLGVSLDSLVREYGAPSARPSSPPL